MSKEFIFNLVVEDEDVVWKCVVHDDEVVTYEGDEECKHLKITNPEKKKGVLQIDTVTKVYDEILPFQLENGVPYVKIEGEWIMSDTTMEDRLQAKIKSLKKQSYGMFALGLGFFVFMAGRYLIAGTLGDWAAEPMLGSFCFACGVLQLFRLKQELDAMGRPFSWKL